MGSVIEIGSELCFTWLLARCATRGWDKRSV